MKKKKKSSLKAEQKQLKKSKRKNILWATLGAIASVGVVAAGVSCGIVYGCSNTDDSTSKLTIAYPEGWSKELGDIYPAESGKGPTVAVAPGTISCSQVFSNIDKWEITNVRISKVETFADEVPWTIWGNYLIIECDNGIVKAYSGPGSYRIDPYFIKFDLYAINKQNKRSNTIKDFTIRFHELCMF